MRFEAPAWLRLVDGFARLLAWDVERCSGLEAVRLRCHVDGVQVTADGPPGAAGAVWAASVALAPLWGPVVPLDVPLRVEVGDVAWLVPGWVVAAGGGFDAWRAAVEVLPG